MTVQSIDPQVIYDGDAVTRVFPFGFDMAAESTLRVSFVSLGLVETVVPPEDYSVTRFGQGGEVTFDLAPPADVKVVLTRRTPLTQQVSVTAQTAYDPRVVESVWDKLTVVSQELAMAQQTMLRGAPGTDPSNTYKEIMLAAEVAVENAGIALVAREGAENARDASQTAQGLAEGARDVAVTARGGAESARDTANTHAGSALTYRNQAQALQEAAATSAGNAATSATTASNAAIATADDRVQTGLDKAATAADRVQTGLDKAATAADRTAAETAAALANGMPLGTIMHFAADTPPAGWLVCDGTATTLLYPDLWAYLLGSGATFGHSKNTAGNLLPGVNPAEDLSVWSVSRATAESTGIKSPDGTSDLWKLVETTAVGEHFADRNVNVTLGQTYYFSALVKPDADRSVELRTALAASNRGVVVDAAGNVLRREGVGSELVVRLPSGLIFVQIGVTANATGTGVFRLQSCGPVGERSTTGVVGKGVLVWGMRTATDAVPHIYPMLPDLRGEFVRGWDGGRGVDAGRVFGAAQGDAVQDHNHLHGDSSYSPRVKLFGSTATPNTTTRPGGNDTGTIDTPYTSKLSDAVGSANARFAAETRPRNIALLPCIRAYASVVNVPGQADLDNILQQTQAIVDAGVVEMVSYLPKNFLFTASGTWVKPEGIAPDRLVKIEVWAGGGGGSGSSSGSSAGAGGGGGGYAFREVRFSEIPAEVPVTVGAGGSGAAAGTHKGSDGGTSSFGSILSASGGIGGNLISSATTGGAGGGVGGGAASTNVGSPATILTGGGSGGGGFGNAGGVGLGGGGGGGSGNSSAAGGAGGVSALAGNGGSGGNEAAKQGGSGAIPSGGGGGSRGNVTPGGNGARGEVRITIL